MFSKISTHSSLDYSALLKEKTIKYYPFKKLIQKYPKKQQEKIHKLESQMIHNLINTKYSDKKLLATKYVKNIFGETKTIKNEAVKKKLNHYQHIIIQLLNPKQGIKDYQGIVSFMNQDDKLDRFLTFKYEDSLSNQLTDLQTKIEKDIRKNVLGIRLHQDFDVKIERLQLAKQQQQYAGFYFRLHLKNFKRQKRTFLLHQVYQNKILKKQQSKSALIYAVNDNQYTRVIEDGGDQIKQNYRIKITQISPQKIYQYILFNYYRKDKIFNKDNNLFDWPAHRFIGNLGDDCYLIWALDPIKQHEIQICKKLGINYEQSSFIDLGQIYPKQTIHKMDNGVLLKTKQPIKPQRNPQLNKQQRQNYLQFHMTKVTSSFQTRDVSESGKNNFKAAIKRCQKIKQGKIQFQSKEQNKSIRYNFQNQLQCCQTYVLYAIKKQFLFNPTYNFVDEKVRISRKVEDMLEFQDVNINI